MWAQGDITDQEFVAVLQFLINRGIITVPDTADTTEDKQTERSVTQDMERSMDVLMYGYIHDNPGIINSAHTSLLESKGYTVVARHKLVDVTEIHDAKVIVIIGNTGSFGDPAVVPELKKYVENGGRLLLLADTQYQHCVRSDPNNSSCYLDFTADTFGFRFDGSVQYSTLYPDPDYVSHPIWNHPNKVDSFTDWCCDAYVSEIIDIENIAVL